MEISRLVERHIPEDLLADGDETDGDLLLWRDNDVALSKSPKPPISAGAGVESAIPKVALISEDKEELSTLAANHMPVTRIDSHLHDCATLTSMQLRVKYRGEANSHRNMLQREKELGRTIHHEFRKFRDFLMHVGPQTFPRATLDRIDNADPEYAPGKVRWADKRTQNSNKGDTLSFWCSRTRESYSVRRLAARQKVSRSAIRKRVVRGWSDDEIIAGRILPKSPSAPFVKTPPPKAEPDLLPPLDFVWDEALAAARPGECRTLTKAEKEMANSFAAYCAAAGLICRAEEIFRYVLDNWTAYTNVLHKDHGVHKPANAPTVGLIAAFPRAAVNLWLHANCLELKGGVVLPIPQKPPTANLTSAPKEPTRYAPRWDETSAEELFSQSYEDDIIYFMSLGREVGVELGPEAHTHHVVGVWRAHGGPMVRDFPQWVKGILAKEVPTFADRLRELEQQVSPPGTSEPSSR